MPTGYHVTFMDPDTQATVGRSRKYRDESKLYDILRAAHAPLEARQAVEIALRSQRPGRVVLTLTPDQYHRLKFGS